MEEIAIRYTREFIHVYGVFIVVSWMLMAVSVLIDLWTGVEKAKAKKEKIDSHNLRRTITKMSEYWRIQIFAVMFDVIASMFVQLPYASGIACVAILCIEGFSVIENLREKKSAAANIAYVLPYVLMAAKAIKENDYKTISDILKNRTDANVIMEQAFKKLEE